MALQFFNYLFRSKSSSNNVPSAPITEEEKTKVLFDKFGPNEVLFRWSCEGIIRGSKTNPKFVRMFAIIGIVVGILLALMQDFVLLLAIASTIFFYYVLRNKYVPSEIEYEISNYGFKYGDKVYYWMDLKHFFFSKRGDQELLILVTNEDIFGNYVILFKLEDKEKIFELLKNRILFLEKEPKNPVDNFLDYVSSKLNTEGK